MNRFKIKSKRIFALSLIVILIGLISFKGNFQIKIVQEIQEIRAFDIGVIMVSFGICLLISSLGIKNSK
jgi:hypothetical protein